MLAVVNVGCDMTASWTEEQNTNVASGQSDPADTLPDCQTACFDHASCTGVDWDAAAPVSMKWL